MDRPLSDKFWLGAKITHAMADSRVEAWERIFNPFRDKIRCVLEIGSYEGQSALFWHRFFGAEVTCIDTWANAAPGADTPEEVEAHFDANIAGLPIRKIKGPSREGLVMVDDEWKSFDLIYIDGDHTRLQVMVDSCLAWPMLRSGGFMVWDDYREYCPDLADRPAPAIDAFVGLMGAEIETIADTGQQLIVRKK
jgi:methyltransferase family protein